MRLESARFHLLFLLAFPGITAGCGSRSPSAASLPHFDDLASAPAPIQAAARAVVRVRTAGALASGSFISPTGLLLTNNHVLGVPVCPIEGCSIQITAMHQRGVAYKAPESVFAVPVTVDEGLDLAVVQLYASPRDATGAKLDSPDYLSWNAQAPRALLGTHITVVGHPEGKLKKWTDGVVTDAFGSWFSSTAYILPGDSGSPALDDQGHIVGLMHHSSTAQDMVTSDGVDEESEGTASEPLSAAMGEPMPAAMISVTAPATSAAVVQNHLVYLNGRATAVTVTDGATPSTLTDVLALLGAACDAALLDTHLESIDQLGTTLAPCYAGEAWIECRADETPSFVQTVCPASADVTSWKSRYAGISQRWTAINGELDDNALSFATAALASQKASGVSLAAASLQGAASAVGHVLDFSLGYYLSAFDVGSYDGTAIAGFEQNYASEPQFQRSAEDIAAATTWLASYGAVTVDQMKATLAGLAGDPQVSVGAKLWIEEYQYNSGWIE
jgi:V8-like Glu-specific endopeptidase